MSKKYALYRFVRFFGKPILKIAYHPQIIHNDRIPLEGGMVIAGNHKHALDPILIDISTKRIVRTLAKKDLHDGAFGWMFKGVGTIPVDLHKAHNPEAYHRALDALREGELINLSPEAKRNYTDELLLPFKYGGVKMASVTGVPILPYAIVGDYKFIKGKLKIVYGEPFYLDEYNGDLTAANRRLYNEIAKLMKENAEPSFIESKHFTEFDEWEALNKK